MIMRFRNFNLCFCILLALVAALPHVQAQNTKHIEKIESKWMSLMPNIGVMQYAGNIGFMSAGIGWDYGKNNRWETHLLLGYLPHFTFDDDAATITLREQFMPCQYRRSELFSVNPLTLSTSLNAVLNNEFWFTEPINNNYYRVSTKVRFHLGVGSRINWYVPYEKRRRYSRISLYYELSTYDLALISYVRTSHQPLVDILSLGIGLNVSIY